MPEDLSVFARWGLDLLGAVAILVVGWIVARWAGGLVRRSSERNERMDKTIAMVLARLTRFAILGITLYAVLSQFGVDMAAVLSRCSWSSSSTAPSTTASSTQRSSGSGQGRCGRAAG